jgi:DNA-binding SARP family transcriptional activator
MEIRLLGPVQVVAERGPVRIGSEKQRALLALLALQPSRLVTSDAIVDGLWGEDPPDGTVKALRFHVSRLRAILRQADAVDLLETRPHGYLLAIPDDAVDVGRFERAVAGARSARSEGATPTAVSAALREALGLWTGPALADVDGAPFVAGERRRLDELRLATTEDYVAAELATGRHAEAVGELERLVDRHPLRERLWELLITALYRSGRQADALAAYQRLRRTLADELGLEPSARLRQLEHDVLVQDPALAAPSAGSGHPMSRDADAPPTDAVVVEAPLAPPAGAAGRPGHVLAAIALALGLVALALLWLGIPSALIAGIGIACGAVAVSRASRANRRIGWAAPGAILAGVVALSAVLGLAVYRYMTADNETAADTTVPTTSPLADREAVDLKDLQLGDCFVLPRSYVTGTVPDAVWRVPCQAPHDAEVFHLFTFLPGPYPGDAEVEARSHQQCVIGFKLYVGISPDLSELNFAYAKPDESLWNRGIRKGGCALYYPTGRKLIGSKRDAKV